jgi:hypothetical protein
LLTTRRAGTLQPGDEFRLPTKEPGSVFRFIGLRQEKNGHSVSAYGGDADPKGRRQWRAFTTEQVIEDARPPGAKATRRKT